MERTASGRLSALSSGPANQRWSVRRLTEFFKIVVAQSCFKQPLFAPSRVYLAAPDLASRQRY
ncbi:hypothetical protein SJS50_20990, partial [Aeromonas caviae]|uniref:hypothetical protein n=1 Tax=Aeromonas caviae TaxID=648 RepID=UPI0029D6AAD3